MSNHPRRGLAATHCRLNPEVFYRLRYICSTQNCIPTPKSPPHTGAANRTPSAPLSAAAPHPQEGFPEARPVSFSQEGFPKGRGAARPFVSFQGGAGGNRNPPAFLFRGPGGHSLFKREYPLGFSAPKRYSSAGNSGPMWEHQIKPARRTAPRCCCPLSLRQ